MAPSPSASRRSRRGGGAEDAGRSGDGDQAARAPVRTDAACGAARASEAWRRRRRSARPGRRRDCRLQYRPQRRCHDVRWPNSPWRAIERRHRGLDCAMTGSSPAGSASLPASMCRPGELPVTRHHPMARRHVAIGAPARIEPGRRRQCRSTLRCARRRRFGTRAHCPRLPARDVARGASVPGRLQRWAAAPRTTVPVHGFERWRQPSVAAAPRSTSFGAAGRRRS